MALPLRKIVLVGGSGYLGAHILKALREDDAFEVTVVSRQCSSATFPPNTKVVKVGDSYPKAEMVDVFKDQDAVILALNLMATVETHAALVDASIEAGVKRLIPSIWASRLDIAEARDIFPLAALKAQFLEQVQSKSAPGWSWTAVCCGLFFELCMRTNFFGLDPISHSGRIWDDGLQKFSASTMDAIGVAVTRILHKPGETANRTVFISSFETSMNELLEAYKIGTGVSDWNISYGETDAAIHAAVEKSKTAQDFMDRMQATMLLGLLVCLKKECGHDFVAEGISDNELLEMPRGNLIECVRHSLRG
ncbi:NAD(P)-binding protein [Lojkania enalia]|uniref:NAD(P)-binding protein n=1 Tax=Lojkania enalia TaxID=147567 RepID=A0A9P4MV63_9PLEO|nr:NAD(P)-binding protein [Didymosphaeria enalia]